MNNNRNTINKEITDIVTLIIILAICCILSWYETHYTREATVDSIENNTVTVIDDYGNYWNFESEGFCKGDRVEMLMDTMHTELDIYDDEIQNVYIIQ